MPCYDPWDSSLTRGTREYDDARARVTKLAEATRHTINAYLQIHAIRPPDGLIDLPFPGSPDKPRRFNLDKIGAGLVHAIAQHCLCDSIHFTDLYDARTMWDRDGRKDAAYFAIASYVAWSLRQGLAAGRYDREKYLQAGWADIKKHPAD